MIDRINGLYYRVYYWKDSRIELAISRNYILASALNEE